MPVATTHVLHGIANGSMFLSQIKSARPMTGMQKILGIPAGLPFPLFSCEAGQQPTCPVSTEQILTLLSQTGSIGSVIDLSGANTDLLLKKVPNFGRRYADANGVHKRLRMTEAFLSVDRITAGHNKVAEASCRLIAIFDGTNAPIIAAGSVTLTGTPTASEQFTAGPMELNVDGGVLIQVPAIQDLTIDFRRQLYQLGGDSELYPTFGAQQDYSPIVTVKTLDFDWDVYGINCHTITSGIWYLKRKGAPPIADGASSHIKFAAGAGSVYIDESSLGGNQPAMTTLVCDLVGGDASTEPIAVTLNTPIV